MLNKDKLNNLLINELVACESELDYFEILLNQKFTCMINVQGPKTETGHLMVSILNDRNYIFERLINRLCQAFKLDVCYEQLKSEQCDQIANRVFEIYENQGVEFAKYSTFQQVVQYIFLLNLNIDQAQRFEHHLQQNYNVSNQKNYVRTFIAEPMKKFPKAELGIISSNIIRCFSDTTIQVIAENSVIFAEQLSIINPQNTILNSTEFINSLKLKSIKTLHKYAQFITGFDELVIDAVVKGNFEFIDYIFEYNVPNGIDYVFDQVYSNQQIMDHIKRYYIYFQVTDVQAKVKKGLIELCTYLQLNHERVDCELSPDRLAMVKLYYQDNSDFINSPRSMSRSEISKRLAGNYNSQEAIAEYIVDHIRDTLEYITIRAKFEQGQWYEETEYSDYKNVYQLLDGLLNKKTVKCVYAEGDLYKAILSEQSDTVLLTLDPDSYDNPNGVIFKRELLIIILDQLFSENKKALSKLLSRNEYVEIESRIQKQMTNPNLNNIDRSSYVLSQIISFNWNSLQLDRLPIKKQILINNNIPLIEY